MTELPSEIWVEHLKKYAFSHSPHHGNFGARSQIAEGDGEKVQEEWGRLDPYLLERFFASSTGFYNW